VLEPTALEGFKHFEPRRLALPLTVLDRDELVAAKASVKSPLRTSSWKSEQKTGVLYRTMPSQFSAKC
jgi:hypothetical protein